MAQGHTTDSTCSIFDYKRLVLAILFTFSWATACSTPEAPLPTSTTKPVEVINDQTYHSDEDENHLLDIYLPNDKEGPFPVLVMIHGGNGDKRDLIIWGHTFAKKGFAAISINHRQWPDHQYPAHIEDAFCALAWIFNSSEIYPFDTDQIFVMGHSAGGTLAAVMGVVNDPAKYMGSCPNPLPDNKSIKGVITFTVIFDYITAAEESPALGNYAIELLGGSSEEMPAIWQEASPASWVDISDPPFLIIHGEDDQSISPEQSRQAADILKEIGVAVQLILIPGASHNQIKSSSQSMDAVEVFLSTLSK